MNKKWNDLAGYVCTSLGGVLLASSLYLGGAPDVQLSRSSRIVAITGTAVTGGVLSFGVGRRLLSERVDGTRPRDRE